MIIKGSDLPAVNGRRFYDLAGHSFPLTHFVTRVTTPDLPFPPHKHEAGELWYVLGGAGLLFLDGTEYEVEKGDLVVLAPWTEHGIRSETRVEWLCLG